MLEATPGRICLTSDLWSSLTTDGYICLTGHFIDKDWHLQKRILSFSFMPPPHNGISLAAKIHNFLKDWGMDKKIFSITLDNASANDVCVQFLKTELILEGGLLCDGDFFHIRCCAHILNLIVQEGLKEIDGAVQKIRESIKYVKGSQSRKQKFLECVAMSNLNAKRGLRQDVPTRWNSTFFMLDSALYYRRAFIHLDLSDENYKHCLELSEWEKVEKISKFLGVFYDITCIFSGTNYPTANLYFPAVFTAYLTLKEALESADDFIKIMAAKMIAKFEKYWADFSMILAVAVILDPRYKFGFVEWCYKKLHGDSGTSESMSVKAKLVSIFNEYVYANAAQNLSSQTTSNISAKCSNIGSQIYSYASESSFSRKRQDVLQEFDSFESQEAVSQKSQLELYLDEPRIDRKAKMDVLAFWRANQYRYPEVAAMAHDILSIPISTVASESAFSVGGRVLDQYRSALKPDTVEALVCTRDWLYGEHEMAKLSLEELTHDVIELNGNENKVSPFEDSSSVKLGV